MTETEIILSSIPDQRVLWDRQHARRGTVGPEATSLRDVPNEGAQIFASHLTRLSTILEIGPGNGRDARYWASLGHHVICADISQVALDQLTQIAQEQGLLDRLTPVQHDISAGELPTDERVLDGFYARSALHIDDQTTMTFAGRLNKRLAKGATICIEGKSPNDHKISRSINVGDGLALDQWENGHLRRIWTPEFMQEMCLENGWRIESLREFAEVINNRNTVFNRLIAKKD